MDTPAALVLSKDKIFFSETSNSHEDIIETHHLHEGDVKGPDIVRVVILPIDGNYDTDPATWKFQVVQHLLPDWYDPVADERRARCTLNEWLKHHCCTQTTQHATGGFMVNQRYVDPTILRRGLFKIVKVRTDPGAVQVAGDYAVQNADCYAAVQTAGNYAIQTADDAAVQTAGEYSIQRAVSAARQCAGVWVIQRAEHKSVQVAQAYARQEAGSDANQCAGVASIQTVNGRAKQKAGVGSVQIVRWEAGNKSHTASRVVTEAEADRWYEVVRGVWTPCEPPEDQPDVVRA